MSEADRFEDDWLALREGADDRARDTALESRLVAALAARRGAGPCRVLDLGSGTGANFRRLVPRLGHDQHWTLVDHDAALLARLEARLAPWADGHGARFEADGDALRLRGPGFDARVRRVEADLATGLDALPFEGRDLVTASALLDLAGADWIDALAARCAAAGAAVLFVLSYDGRAGWTPPLEEDAEVHARFDRHQRQDKGLGPALGPDAAARFVERLRGHGLDVATATSDWRLEAGDAALQRELADGFAGAAREIDPGFAARAADWLLRRRAAIDAGRATSLVGHLDVAASARHGGVIATDEERRRRPVASPAGGDDGR